MSRRTVRQYFQTQRGWKPVIYAVLITALWVALFLVLIPNSHAYPEPTTRREFAQLFRSGQLGHAPANIHYSRAFKRSYMTLYRRAARQHRGVATRTARTQWDNFTHTDVCAGTIYTEQVCRTNPRFQRLLASPYWQGRSNAQNEWTVKILFCGGLGVAAFYTGGTAAAAAGPVSGGCLGAWWIGAKYDG